LSVISKVPNRRNIGGLVKIDSISNLQFDSELIFQDIDPFSETVLLYNQIDSIERLFYVFDFDGNIQSHLLFDLTVLF